VVMLSGKGVACSADSTVGGTSEFSVMINTMGLGTGLRLRLR
jgi:hypothetical protein